jgi:ABC-type multidrug transport system permease subunit
MTHSLLAVTGVLADGGSGGRPIWIVVVILAVLVAVVALGLQLVNRRRRS